MKRIVFLLICLIEFSSSILAQPSMLVSKNFTPYSLSSYGRKHTVRPYFKIDGSFVRGYRAGNPRSSIWRALQKRYLLLILKLREQNEKAIDNLLYVHAFESYICL